MQSLFVICNLQNKIFSFIPDGRCNDWDTDGFIDLDTDTGYPIIFLAREQAQNYIDSNHINDMSNNRLTNDWETCRIIEYVLKN